MAKKNETPKGMIKVIALQSFGASVGDDTVLGTKGKVMMMPQDADWIKAGLVEPVGRGVSVETATVSAPEKSVAAQVDEAHASPPEEETEEPAETEPSPDQP